MILAGLLAFLLVLVVLRDNSVTNFIAKAAVEIPAGTTITGDDVELVEVTGESLIGVVLSADEVNAVITEGRVTTRALAVGTLLQPADFAVTGVRTDIRSMSIPVSPTRAVAGSLKAGDLVDVVASDDEVSWYVTTSAEVLGVAEASSGGFASNDYTITIVVDPIVSLRLACGMENYSLNVVRATGATPIQLPDPPDKCS
jgi:Flp pilus assembly protein CpaB